VLGHLGLEVTRLIRVSFGPFQLTELAEGQVEEVKTRVLREQLGTKLVALSGADFSTPPRPPRPASTKRDKPQAPQQKPVHHAWRPREEERPGKKLRRQYHGSGAAAEIRRKPPAGEARKAALTDRKGRVVPVERHGEAKRHTEARRDRDTPRREEARKPFEKRGRGGNNKQQRHRSPDRSAGPRPRNPRSR
jgi:23S rRNA pseudouridine2605 synthase